MITDRIEINPAAMLGKPVIRGTRIPAELILCKLSEGATKADLVAAYPRLTRADIHAALAYAADAVGHETILLETSPRAKSAVRQAPTERLGTVRIGASGIGDAPRAKTLEAISNDPRGRQWVL